MTAAEAQMAHGTWHPDSPDVQARQRVVARRLNVGCGRFPLLGWTNLDASADALADIRCHVPPLPYADGGLDEIYAGHFLEHLTQKEADAFLDECHRCLSPGGKLGIVVPDTYTIMREYLSDNPEYVEYPRGQLLSTGDLDNVCALFLYSTIQDSPHQWSYDRHTLRRLLARHSFTVTGEINRLNDPRIPVGAWYQCGLDAVRA